jgi:hypothetical protein
VGSVERLPEPSADLIITLAGLEAERERRGNAWCEKHGVGARRLILDREMPANVEMLPSSERPGYAAAKAGARVLLAVHCRQCGGCPFARK